MKILYRLVITTVLFVWVAFGPKDFLWWVALVVLYIQLMVAIIVIELEVSDRW